MNIGIVLGNTITELYPNEKWRYEDVTPALDLSNLKFENGFVPDKAKVQEVFDVKIVEFEANRIATQYQRDRRYPHVGEQLDILFHDMAVDKATKDGEWYKAVAKVKADNPKE